MQNYEIYRPWTKLIQIIVILFIGYLQETGETCLHAAVKRRDTEITKILIDASCPVDVQNVSILFVK